MARSSGSRGTAPTSGQTGSSRPRPADARLPPGGRPHSAPPGPRHFFTRRPHVRAPLRVPGPSAAACSRGGARPGAERVCTQPWALTFPRGLNEGYRHLYTQFKQEAPYSCIHAALGVSGLSNRSPRPHFSDVASALHPQTESQLGPWPRARAWPHPFPGRGWGTTYGV